MDAPNPLSPASLARNLADRRWRLDNLYWIVDKAGRRVPFRLNGVQDELFEELHCLNLVLKSRQHGVTTVVCVLMVDACVFNSNVSAGVVAHKISAVKEIFKSKVRFVYDSLPGVIKARVPAVEDSAQVMRFANGSQLMVDTSLRSGTYQWLLVSEYGKICAKTPDKAAEVRTGALNTVKAGQFICVESTAEGQQGHFYELCRDAQDQAGRGDRLTPLDFKLHFFAWFRDPENRLDPEGVSIPQEMADYFEKLEADHGIVLDDAQKAWYVKKAAQQGEHMKREHPSTPEEAFEAAVEGAIWGREMARAEQDGRICSLPVVSGVPVNTFWDVGLNNDMALWCHQQVGAWHHFVGFHQASGEGWAYFRRWLDKFQERHECAYGRHFGPHDIVRRQLGVVKPKTNKQLAAEAGIRFEDAVPRCEDKWADIQAVKGVFGACRFDKERCSEGITCLKLYSREWDEKRGKWKDWPMDNQFTNGADAFRTFGRGWKPAVQIVRPEAAPMGPRRSGGWMGA